MVQPGWIAGRTPPGFHHRLLKEAAVGERPPELGAHHRDEKRGGETGVQEEPRRDREERRQDHRAVGLDRHHGDPLETPGEIGAEIHQVEKYIVAMLRGTAG